MYRIGIDLGGTNIAAGIVNEKLEILCKASIPTGAERSAAEMPVVVPIASMETVNAVWWLSVFISTIWCRSSRWHQSADMGMQMSPLA